MTDRFKALPLYGRVLLGLFALLVAWEVVGGLAAPLSGDGDRAVSSSFSTKDPGMAAYAELLAKAGHEVTRERGSLASAGLSADGSQTLVVAGAVLDDDETDEVEEFVQSGGRVVLMGGETEGAAQAIVGDGVSWSGDAAGPLAEPVVSVREVSSVQGVVAAGSGSWESTGPALPLLVGEDGGVLAAAASVGAGRVVLIADATVLQNRLLAQADNAAFGLAVAGQSSRRVVFAEGSRGGSGWAAIPRQWRTALFAAAVAALLAMWSAGRRFGPPEDEARPLAPPRKAYIDALAVTLLKTKQPDAAMAPLRAAARERIRRRATLPPEASDEQLRKAAAELGLSTSEIAAVFGGVTDDERALALGRAMARLGGSKW